MHPNLGYTSFKEPVGRLKNEIGQPTLQIISCLCHKVFGPGEEIHKHFYINFLNLYDNVSYITI